MTRINRGFQRTTLGSVLWLLCFQYFVAEQIARLASRAPYSVARNVISDLGAVRCVVSTADAVCSPLHWLMNSSFVLQGLLIFFGGLLVRNVFPRGKLFTVALILITLSGIGLSIVGLAPEDVHRAIHYAAAAEHFLLNNIGVALLGAALLLQSRWPRLFAWSGCHFAAFKKNLSWNRYRRHGTGRRLPLSPLADSNRAVPPVAASPAHWRFIPPVTV
jgi:hypothetical membrane protein